MDAKIKELIDKLKDGCEWRYTGDGSDTLEVDSYKTNGTMKETGAILQAIFDPENQPSQFGTQLLTT